MRLKVGLTNLGLLAAITALLFIAGPLEYTSALLGELPNRYLKLSDNIQSTTNVNYELGFDTSVPATIGSFEIEFCENDPLPATSCTVPTGFDVSGAVLLSQSGTNDFIIDVPNTIAHRIVFSRTPTLVGITTFKFELGGVTNPGNNGTQYARIMAYTGSGTGGSVGEAGGLAYSINGNIGVSTEVPPHIDLCVGVTVSDDCLSTIGDSLDLGNLNVNTPKVATSQFASATNAANGYTVSISGNSLTSGNNVIQAIGALSTSVPGTNQFGINLRQNTSPSIGEEPSGSGTAAALAGYNIPDNFLFNSGSNIVSAPGSDNFRKFTVSYIVNISRNQPAGIYSTTMTFIALGNF